MAKPNYKIVSSLEIQQLQESLQEFLEPSGFECHVFKIGWYNEKVDSIFHLSYHYDTIALAIISVPKMFEKTFLPFVLSHKDKFLINEDPLDQCIRIYFEKIKELLIEKEIDIEVIYDSELTPKRRPRVVMQTVGHVSGAARYYHRNELGDLDPWDKKKYIMGVCIHPQFGGWFAFRGVIIMKNILCKELPLHVLESEARNPHEIIKLLSLFNDHWKDERYRDFPEVKEQYSNAQKLYFATPPSERSSLLQSWLNQRDSSILGMSYTE